MRSRPGVRAGQPGVHRMPVLVTRNRKGLAARRAETATHSASVAGRPTAAKRCAAFIPPRIAALGWHDFRPSVLTW
jgi:hypothetical protein